ncbi:MAG: OstA-like protein [Bacteroidota bacterium]|nr:OstA-like protein [Bacteroidota bacterium]
MITNLLRYILPGVVLFMLVVVSHGQENKKIQIISADKASFDKSSGINARRLIGNVGFKHDDAFMYCDSAWFYAPTNSMDAFGNVKMEQGDSLVMTGRFMSYSGNTKIAKVRDSVVLIHKQSRVFTDSLNYDREANFGYFFDGGKVLHQEIEMTSLKGYYYPESEDYYAVDSVHLVHPDYIIDADSLKYNTNNEITDFLGPTTILTDSSRIECITGWYDTKNDLSAFGKNTVVYQQSQTLWADSIFYNNKTGDGKAWWNVYLLDTLENFAGSGNYAEYNDIEDRSMMTDSALVMYYENDDTTYIHGDTVFLFTDSLDNRIIQTYYKVQMFKSDMQGRCDSLIYTESDSLIRMYHDPVLWSEENQITADTIELFLKNKKADSINMLRNALIVMQEDSIRFSQISGKNMYGQMKHNELSKIFIPENARTIYYVRDEGSEDIIGVNEEKSSEMTVFRQDGKIERISYVGKPDGSMIPEEDTNPLDIRFENFKWLNEVRPRIVSDIFIWYK